MQQQFPTGMTLARARTAMKALGTRLGVSVPRQVLTTTYQVTAGPSPPPRLFVRHPRRSSYTAVQLPPESETSADALLVPCALAAEKSTALTLIEQRQTRRTIALKNSNEPLGPYLAGTKLPLSTQQQLAKSTNEQKLHIQAVLEFFGQEDVARVVKASPKLVEIE